MTLDIEDQIDNHAHHRVATLLKENTELRARIAVLEAQLREAQRQSY